MGVIPRIAHFIWLGGPLPDHLAELCETFREHHPEWAIWWWNEQAIDHFGLEQRDIYDRAAEYVPSDSVYQLQSDIARVEILHQFGGAYIDCDFLWHAPVDDLLDGHEVVTPWERQWVNVANGFIATVPGHPVLREVIDGLPGRAEVHNRTLRANRLTGPSGLWNDTLRRHRSDAGVRILHQRLMMHVTWRNPDRAGVDIPADAVASHMWNHQKTIRSSSVVTAP